MFAPKVTKPQAKAVENLRKKIRVNAFAVVDDLNLRLRSDTSQPHLDMPVTRSELHGIREKVRKDLLQTAGISYDDHRSRRRGHIQRDTFRGCRGPK